MSTVFEAKLVKLANFLFSDWGGNDDKTEGISFSWNLDGSMAMNSKQKTSYSAQKEYYSNVIHIRGGHGARCYIVDE